MSAIARRDFGKLLNAGEILEAIRSAGRELELDREHGVELRLTGSEVLNYEELQLVAREGRIVAVVSLALFTLAVFFALRSAGVVAAQIATLVAGLVWTNAFAAAAVGHLNQVSAVFNVLIIGLGGELGIHFCLRYAELVGHGQLAPRGPGGDGDQHRELPRLERGHDGDRLPGLPADGLPGRGGARPDLRGGGAALPAWRRSPCSPRCSP